MNKIEKQKPLYFELILEFKKKLQKYYRDFHTLSPPPLIVTSDITTVQVSKLGD